MCVECVCACMCVRACVRACVSERDGRRGYTHYPMFPLNFINLYKKTDGCVYPTSVSLSYTEARVTDATLEAVSAERKHLACDRYYSTDECCSFSQPCKSAQQVIALCVLRGVTDLAPHSPPHTNLYLLSLHATRGFT